MNIPSLSELKNLPFNEAKERFLDLKKNFKNKDLMAAWGINNYEMNKLNKLYGSPHKRGGKRLVHRAEGTKAKESLPGFAVTLQGIYNGEEARARLESLAQLLVGEKYQITLTISETA